MQSSLIIEQMENFISEDEEKRHLKREITRITPLLQESFRVCNVHLVRKPIYL